MSFVDFALSRADLLVKPVLVFLVVFIVALTARTAFYRVVHRWAVKTETTLDDVFISATKGQSLLWSLIIGVHVALGASDLTPETVSYARKCLGALIALSVTLALSQIALEAFRLYSHKTKLPVTGLTEVVMKIVIIALGISLSLSLLGIDITPLIAALGVGGLAIALGLQDTLASLFAGIHILLSNPIRVGDYVKLDSGEAGYVLDIGWRATQIRMLPNNMVIVPNSRLVQSIIRNYHMPQQELAVVIQVGVDYDSDLQRVEQITREVARETMQTVQGGVSSFEPFIRYHTFGDSSINFSVILRAREFVDSYLIKHEFIKALHARYREEGINIPFPIRTLDIRQEALERVKGCVSEQLKTENK